MSEHTTRRVMPDTVIFDLGGVLIDWNPRYLYRRLFDDEPSMERFLAEVCDGQWNEQQDAGRSWDEAIRLRSAEFPEHAALLDAYATRFNETIDRPIEGTHEIVGRLHAAGVPLFALTNFGAEFFAGFRPTEPIFELFEDIVVSGEECVAKPDPAIFAIAEKRFARAPGELFFTDDNPANVAAARACGWHAHLFDSAAGLEAELVRLGLFG